MTLGTVVFIDAVHIGARPKFLAQKAGSVRGVKIIPEAISDARKNAQLNGITNAGVYVGKAEEVLPEVYEKEKCRADVIMVDPPRKGCDELLLQTIIKMQPERVVYVSCDSATLARDLRWMGEHGYETKKVKPVDMFGMGCMWRLCACLAENPQFKRVSGLF